MQQRKRQGKGNTLTFGKWGNVIKQYKFPIKRFLSLKDLIYTMVTIVSNTVLYICNLLKRVGLKSSYYHQKEKVITM